MTKSVLKKLNSISKDKNNYLPLIVTILIINIFAHKHANGVFIVYIT